MNHKPPLSVVFHIKMTEAMHEAIRKIAFDRRKSIADVIRDAIQVKIDESKDAGANQ